MRREEMLDVLASLAGRSFTFEDRVGTEIEQISRRIISKCKPGKPTSDSEHDFALRILKQLGFVRAAIRGGHTDDAARWGFELGVLVVKAGWKPLVDKGQAQDKNLADGRSKTNERRKADASKKWDRVQREADDIWRGKPHLTISAVASTVRRRRELKLGAVSLATIKDRIKKPR